MNTIKHFKLTQNEKRLLRQENMNHKDRRKAAKLKKKMRHLAYTSKVSYEEVCKEATTKKKATSEKPKVLQTKTKSTALEKRSLKEEKRREKQRLLQKELLENDNREIKKYEKLLKLKKKKNNALSKSFSIDGLDYLLELCMGNKSYTDGSSDDFTRDTKDSNGDGEEVLSEEEEMDSEDENESGDELEEEMTEERKSENAEFENIERENIYGDQSTSELQCALKHEMLDETFTSPEEQAMAERVEKILKRFINKLSESNVLVSSREVMELFRTNPHHVIKRVFTDVILDACFTAFRLPDRLLITISVLVGILHSTLSSDFSAYFVEILVQKLEEKRTDENEQEIESNALQNGYLLVAYLCAMKVTSYKLLMDIFNSLMQSGRCLDLQLLVPLVRNLGFVLRKACPTDLKDFVMFAIGKMEKHESESSRTEAFTNILMNDLNSIKNNNASKICHYDPDLIDHFTKLLRSCLSGKTPEMPLAFGLMDILEAPTKGRWWIVGSSYVVPVTDASKSGDLNQFNYSEDLLRLAKKNRMNTDLKRNIFCCILSAEDYLNAFEKLLKLNLSDKQEREIIHILFVCCLNERTFNPFYGYLVQKFCNYHAKFVLTTQFALWDKLKILKTLKKAQIQNLSSLIAHLFGSLALPISVLKVINFVEIEETMTDFLKRLFTKFLNSFSTDVLRVVFGKLMKKSNEYRYLREGIRLFIVHFLLAEHEDEEKKEFKRKIRFVDNILLPKESLAL